MKRYLVATLCLINSICFSQIQTAPAFKGVLDQNVSIPAVYGGKNFKITGDNIGTKANTTFKGRVSEMRISADVYNSAVTTDLGGGTWYLDADDHTTPDNTGTVIVTANGSRYKRVYGNFVNLAWFGAVGDGVTDNTAVFKKALNAIGIQAGTTYTNLQPINSIYIPKGVYLVKPNALAPDSLLYSGIRVWSDNSGSATIKLSVPNDYPPGEYFMCSTNGGMDGMKFENINFTTEFSRVGYKNSLFQFINTPALPNWKGRYTQGMTFINCGINFFDRTFVLQGDNLNSEFSFSNCRISIIQESVIEAANSQSLNLLFNGTHIELYCKDVFFIREGGEFHVFGGSYINCSDAQMSTVANPNKPIPSSKDCTLFRCVAENTLSDGLTWTPSSMLYTLDGIRAELRQYGKLVDIRRSNPLSNYTPTVVFNSSNLSDLRSDYVVPDSVPSMVIRSGGKVYLHNCVTPNRQVQLIRDADRAVDAESNDVPELNLDACLGSVHPNDWVKYSYTGVTRRYPWGHLNISNHRWLKYTALSSVPRSEESYNCNTYSYGSSMGGNSIPLKVAIFRPAITVAGEVYAGDTLSGGQVTNPSFTAAAPFTFRLPIGSMIKSITFVTLNGGTPQTHTYVATFAGTDYTIYSGALSAAVSSKVDINKPVTALNQNITFKRTDAANSTAPIIGWFEISYL